MSVDEIEDDEIEEEEEEEESSVLDKKGISQEKMAFKRKLEEYLENKKIEDECNYYWVSNKAANILKGYLLADHG